MPPFFFPSVAAVPVPANHRFPSGKFAALRAQIARDHILARAALVAVEPVATEALLVAHTPRFIDAMLSGTESPQAMRRIGIPWSETLVARSRATVTGAIASGRAALEHGISGQLAGGTHHAHADFGSGFCVFNDLAVATLTLLAEGTVERVAIVDTDVHQGDGNAAILANDSRVFVLSIQGARNFPFRRVPSTLDIDHPDGTEDADYLAALGPALEAVLAFRPDLVYFLSGADPLAEDRLGRLALTFDGLAARDRMVLSTFKKADIPLAIAIGGGYAEPIDLSVRAYANTFRVAAALWDLD